MSEKYTSTVAKWIEGGGYGFIEHPVLGERDLFVHCTDIIQKAGKPPLRELPVGASVEFEIGKGAKGQVAKHVRLLG